MTDRPTDDDDDYDDDDDDDNDDDDNDDDDNDDDDEDDDDADDIVNSETRRRSISHLVGGRAVRRSLCALRV